MKYDRLTYDLKVAIRKYCTTHPMKEAAAKFSVSYSSVVRVINEPLGKPKPVIATHEVPVCSTFGCGRTLTRAEQLYGSKCTNHSKLLIV